MKRNSERDERILELGKTMPVDRIAAELDVTYAVVASVLWRAKRKPIKTGPKHLLALGRAAYKANLSVSDLRNIAAERGA